MSRIIFLGTCHIDEQLPHSLNAALDDISPLVVTVESHPSLRRNAGQWHFSQDVCAKLSQSQRLTEGQIAQVHTYFGKTFFPNTEYETAAAWCSLHGIPLIEVDMDRDVSAAYARTVDNAAEYAKRYLGNPAAFTSQARSAMNKEKADSVYREISFLLRHHQQTTSYLDRLEPEVWIRDGVMAQGISTAIHEHAPDVLVHIGGAVHMLTDRRRRTLFEHHRASKPSRRVITDYL